MILLTRPQKESTELAKILGAENCIIEPMLNIERVDFALPKNHQATITTSKNATYTADISIPAHGKTAAEILDYCHKNLSPTGGKIVYLSGDVVTLDIAASLRESGFDAQRVVVYKQIPTAALSKNFSDNIDEISIASFFSQRSLEVFKQLCDDSKIMHITCVCISKKVAKTARKMSWKNIRIAKNPSAAAMLAQIQQASLDS